MTSIKNWSKFQHFKDRKPPWVKLYRDLLDDREWHQLDPKAAKLLVMLWLIASEDEGHLPDVQDLAFRLRLSESDVKTGISKLSHWLEQDDIAPISQRYQEVPVADVSGHQETEREKEKEREAETRKRASPPAIEGIPEDLLADYMVVRSAKKAGKLTDTAVAGLRREADKAGISLEAAIRACCEFGWQGFNAGWYAERQAKAGTSKPTFAQQAADVRTTTVPAKPGRDPVLMQIEADRAMAKPMTAEIRQALAQAAGRMTQ